MIDTLLSAVALGLLWAVMTIGVYITYRILDVADLTVEGSITTGAAIAATMITGGWEGWLTALAGKLSLSAGTLEVLIGISSNPYFATFVALLGGMCAGLVTGILHTKLKIPALLSGILTMIALYSVNLRIMGRANVAMLRVDTVFSVFQDMGLRMSYSMICVGAIASIAIITILYWFFGTELGSAIRATGNNPNMVRAQGINTDTMKILGLVISNGLVAMSGAMIGQSQAFADIQMGIGSIVIGLASLIIGEVLFSKKNFYMRLLALIFGAVVYRVIIALVLKAGMPTNDLKLFTAITVAFALSLPRIKSYFLGLKKKVRKEAH